MYSGASCLLESILRFFAAISKQFAVIKSMGPRHSAGEIVRHVIRIMEQLPGSKPGHYGNVYIIDAD